MDALIESFDAAHQWLFEQLLQPLMFFLGLGNLLADGYAATGWLLVGVIQILVMITALRALERWRPVEPVSDPAAVRVDVIYTLIHRLGLVRVGMFFAVEPLWDLIAGQMRLAGVPSFQLDAIWPGVSDIPWVSFLLYLVLFDFVNYWLHRAQHQFHWWWQLHALHHSQRQMTLWSDNRNHLLDDVLIDAVFVLLARFVGVEPGQFVVLVALSQLLESLSHANVRLWFGPVLERVLVSPRFHRRHHAIGIGHESEGGRGTLGGCNFAVLFPIWDQLFGTADWQLRFDPTGIRDQLPEEGARDYGRGFWSQQWLGLRRLLMRR
ncbi:MAG: sterol desaturase family protein [Roseateles asaccharophilus]|jgi:sterol desaturase/sphingolipid hydroxylase (fatty acid hydroxylase superfamily)|uniref:Sterol desaturase/sphingolipid hydroxylase (Fatty acid hydroxylase superfamily) n=1 Tax=Roseateles asaccharophilus TaxID=582607 RepID=A0A4V3CJV3_9BURK|nr:sterol desaturase family protein [Roseateles asaccharophilus]MDN3546136.1 sterol desaturase family protein [Roseateles asaccharophilus]TDP11133.1 sterol desaturase/sphingolipid hydroxylase (fatty acid hydroxylase superfamily) [Roseateles asaccharophilus]